MLSIAASSAGAGSYYINLAAEDYYLSGGEPPGIWLGTGAKDLALQGTVEREPFSFLLHGYSPEGARLIQTTGRKEHQAGWDLTFSAPKSVSVIWSQAGDELRRAIADAQHQAVTTTIGYLEEEVATTRRGKGGRQHDAARLIVAAFEHSTARQVKDAALPDPNLHTHCFVMNVCSRKDGSRGTITSKPFYLHQHLSDALYKAELAAGLHRLGFELEKTEHGFEVKGVPKNILQEFSKRREVILGTLEAQGLSGARAAEIANLSTRELKGHIARSVLFQEWQKAGRALGFSTEQVESVRNLRRVDTQEPGLERQRMVPTGCHKIDSELEHINQIDLDELGRRAGEVLTQRQSHFTPRQFLKAIAEEAIPYGVDGPTLRKAAARLLQHSSNFVRLEARGGAERFTTAGHYALEVKMLAQAERSQSDGSHRLLTPSLWAGMRVTRREDRIRLSEEQRVALRHITQRPGSIQVLSGMAGTGKTTLFKAARVAWEREGYKVIGAALSGKAAKGLQDGAGIKSYTISGLLKALDGPGLADHLKHEARQIGRAVLGKQRSELGALEIDKRTVVVLDEAGMVDSACMARIFDEITSRGAKLVLSGDAKQLQPIGAGGLFSHLAQFLGDARLTQIVRQRHDEQRQAIRKIARGEAHSALTGCEQSGHLTVSPTRNRSMQALIRDWTEVGIKKPEETLILIGTRAEAAQLNRMAQDARQQAGVLGSECATVDGAALHVGDRVLFSRNDTTLGVRNGDLGTIRSIIPIIRNLVVTLDSGERVLVPTIRYRSLSLGYAVTTHKAQGATTERAYVLAGGKMTDLHLAYVQASRAREATRFYTEERHRGDTLTQLAAEMSRDRQKDLAHVVNSMDLRMSQST